jgi:RimJ/RimL family protein N-acetyltransferase
MHPQPSAAISGDIQLREVLPADLPEFYEYQCDPVALEMCAFVHRDRETFLAHWKKLLGDSSVTARTILLDGHVAGNIVCWPRDGRHLVGYWIDRRVWGRGVATRALQTFLEIVPLRPLYAYVAKHNIASLRVLEKSGFTHCPQEATTLPSPQDDIEESILKLTAP